MKFFIALIEYFIHIERAKKKEMESNANERKDEEG